MSNSENEIEVPEEFGQPISISNSSTGGTVFILFEKGYLRIRDRNPTLVRFRR